MECDMKLETSMVAEFIIMSLLPLRTGFAESDC
jgi:hypothetical protein